MKTLLWLDDIRNPKDNIWHNWISRNVGNPFNYSITWVKSFDEFEDSIYKFMPDVICFDHDLGDEHYTVNDPDNLDYAIFEEKTGYDCAKWLVEYCLDSGEELPNVFIQSSNPVGADNIRKLLENFQRHCG